MDDLLDPASGSVGYRDICSAKAAGIRSEMRDPELDTFRNLRRMTADKIEHFDPIRPMLGDPFVDRGDFDDSSVNSATGRRKVRSPNRYFYQIGNY
jgi:hypothetical protein